jgi:hypothetical protein
VFASVDLSSAVGVSSHRVPRRHDDSAELDTESYRAYGDGRFLPRAFMQ